MRKQRERLTEERESELNLLLVSALKSNNVKLRRAKIDVNPELTPQSIYFGFSLN